jgi:2-keto-3-deoxy-L-rhamnonate aldolase RhmA
MQPNRLREGVSRGELQIGSWVEMTHNPAILTLMKAAGLDFARIDLEHVMPSTDVIAAFALMSRALDFPIAVRPPANSREWLQRLLDAGVWNLHCPGVGSAQEAAEIVQFSRYWPIGTRGMGAKTPSSEFELKVPMAERMAFANRQVFVTVMLETEKVFDELDEIAGMDGIDALTIGPADLAQNLGIFGSPAEKKILDEKRDLILAAARRHGKTCSMLARSADEAKQFKDAGALILAYKSDVELLYEGFSAVSKFKT